MKLRFMRSGRWIPFIMVKWSLQIGAIGGMRHALVLTWGRGWS